MWLVRNYVGWGQDFTPGVVRTQNLQEQEMCPLPWRQGGRRNILEHHSDLSSRKSLGI